MTRQDVSDRRENLGKLAGVIAYGQLKEEVSSSAHKARLHLFFFPPTPLFGGESVILLMPCPTHQAPTLPAAHCMSQEWEPHTQYSFWRSISPADSQSLTCPWGTVCLAKPTLKAEVWDSWGDTKVCPLHPPSTAGSSPAPARREKWDTGEQIEAKCREEWKEHQRTEQLLAVLDTHRSCGGRMGKKEGAGFQLFSPSAETHDSVTRNHFGEQKEKLKVQPPVQLHQEVPGIITLIFHHSNYQLLPMGNSFSSVSLACSSAQSFSCCRHLESATAVRGRGQQKTEERRLEIKDDIKRANSLS